MSSLQARVPRRQYTATAFAGALGLILVWVLLGPYREQAFFYVAIAAVLGGVVYLAWRADPAWTLTLGLLLSVFGSNWDAVGVPTTVAPDRIILFTGVIAVLARAPASRLRARFHAEPIHWVLALVIVYAVVSAVVVGTVSERAPVFVILERLGVIPFLLFVAATFVFRTERRRQVLLVGLVGLGAYLGLTALFETLEIPLVFPGYIEDPGVGILPDRARGPFLEPATNGLALFTCAGACLLAYSRWRSPQARYAAAAVGALCAAGLLFTVTRQVWIAGAVAGLAAMLSLRQLRRWILPAAAAAAVTVVGLVAVVPGLNDKVTERRTQENTVWDRLNLNRAAINAIEAHPLVGVGWQKFTDQADEYAELDPDFPLTAVGFVNVHNVFLAYGSELGLVGVTLWILALLLGVGGTLRTRGPPEIIGWWALALGVFIFFVVIGAFEFPQAFSNLVVWLLAGLVRAAQLAARDDAAPALP